MKIPRVLTLLMFLSLPEFVSAQWLTEKIRQAPSPDASSLGNFVNFPVAQSSGLIPISVPLSELKTDMLSMPISLSYHGSGVRVEQEAGNVGMGWSLNAGGVITRSLRGSADDIDQRVVINAQGHYRIFRGWLNGSKVYPLNFPENLPGANYGN